MEQNILRKEMWNTAAKAGLVLGLIPTAYMFITMWIAGNPGFLGTVLSMILWIAKFVGCIWVMRFFMKQYAAAHPEIGNKDTFNFGMATALLSALVYSAAAFANVAFISGDLLVVSGGDAQHRAQGHGGGARLPGWCGVLHSSLFDPPPPQLAWWLGTALA